MTARAIFPDRRARPQLTDPAPLRRGPGDAPDTPEAQLAVAALGLWQGGAAARADVTTRLRTAFGPGPGTAIAVALDRLWSVVADDPPADMVSLAGLVAATLHGPDAEDTARVMALRIVPPHRMDALVIAARGLALGLRRAVLLASRHGHRPDGAPGRCPVPHR